MDEKDKSLDKILEDTINQVIIQIDEFNSIIEKVFNTEIKENKIDLKFEYITDKLWYIDLDKLNLDVFDTLLTIRIIVEKYLSKKEIDGIVFYSNNINLRIILYENFFKEFLKHYKDYYKSNISLLMNVIGIYKKDKAEKYKDKLKIISIIENKFNKTIY